MHPHLTVFVSNTELQIELCSVQPSAKVRATAQPADHGFGGSLYPVLVDLGAVAIPASVVAGLLANWLFDAWKRRGRPPGVIIGAEIEGRRDAISLSDTDVERVAQRLRDLLAKDNPPTDGTA